MKELRILIVEDDVRRLHGLNNASQVTKEMTDQVQTATEWSQREYGFSRITIQQKIIT